MGGGGGGGAGEGGWVCTESWEVTFSSVNPRMRGRVLHFNARSCAHGEEGFEGRGEFELRRHRWSGEGAR